MDYKLDDERRKLLTGKVLGECWHEFDESDTTLIPSCKKCDASKLFPWVRNRSFNDAQDMHDVFKKLVDEGKWIIFIESQMLLREMFYVGTIKHNIPDVTAWLFYNPERFCWLVSEWLKQQCSVSQTSSRICEYGTKGCTVYHN